MRTTTLPKLMGLVLLCLAQTGCAILQIPFDLLGPLVSTAVGAGISAAPYAAPFFM